MINRKTALKIILYVFLLYIALVLHTTAPEYIAVGGIKPDIMFVFIVCQAFIYGTAGIAAGTVSGFFTDMVSSSEVFGGFYMLAGVFISAAAAMLRDLFSGIWRYIWMIVWVFALSLLYGMTEYAFIFKNFDQVIYAIRTAVIFRALYNSLLALPITIVAIIIIRRRKGRPEGRILTK